MMTSKRLLIAIEKIVSNSIEDFFDQYGECEECSGLFVKDKMQKVVIDRGSIVKFDNTIERDEREIWYCPSHKKEYDFIDTNSLRQGYRYFKKKHEITLERFASR